MRVCQILAETPQVSETFLADVATYLPAEVTVLFGAVPSIAGRPALSQSRPAQAFRALAGYIPSWEITKAYVSAFQRAKPDVVLAEYGPVGVKVAEACRIARVPLVVRFHGYDASTKDVLDRYGQAYRHLFDKAAAVISVSQAMMRRLRDLGAPAGKLHYVVYGVDCDRFRGSQPGDAPPIFLATGRFVDKKAPHLTVLAFRDVVRSHPAAKLRMIGDGPLLGSCQDLVEQMGMTETVSFLGSQPHAVVADEMTRARVFVQHSVESRTGDCEGTPLAILEAGASGLPVVSTRHGGIPDVVVEGSTGFLVEERDVPAMAARMVMLAEQPVLAGELGQNARLRIRQEFSHAWSMERLHATITGAASAVVR
jgi:colanic acid/amylovoran biosynthesis glycosyltransferase